MKTTRKTIGAALFAAALGLCFAACASTGGGSGDVTAGEGETLIVVERKAAFVASAVKHLIFIDGQQKLELINGATGTIVVPNGEHTIYTVTARPGNSDPMSQRLTFVADGTELHFTTRTSFNNIILVRN